MIIFEKIGDFFGDLFFNFTTNHPFIFIGILVFLFLAVLAAINHFVGYIKECLCNEIEFKKAKKERYLESGFFVFDNEFIKLNKKIHADANRILKKLPDEYFVIENVCFPINNTYAYFNFVVISKYGIFPIVINNALGIIKGSPANKKLIHTTDGVNDFSISNPFDDAKEKTIALSNALGIKYNSLNISPLVVFSDKCRLSITYEQLLYNVSCIANVIKKPKLEKFSQKEISKILCNLETKNKFSKKTYKEAMHSYVIKTSNDYKDMPKIFS